MTFVKMCFFVKMITNNQTYELSLFGGLPIPKRHSEMHLEKIRGKFLGFKPYVSGLYTECMQGCRGFTCVFVFNLCQC